MQPINHQPDLMLITAINEDNDNKPESVLSNNTNTQHEILHIPPRRLGCGVDVNNKPVELKMGDDRNIWS